MIWLIPLVIFFVGLMIGAWGIITGGTYNYDEQFCIYTAFAFAIVATLLALAIGIYKLIIWAF